MLAARDSRPSTPAVAGVEDPVAQGVGAHHVVLGAVDHQRVGPAPRAGGVSSSSSSSRRGPGSAAPRRASSAFWIAGPMHPSPGRRGSPASVGQQVAGVEPCSPRGPWRRRRPARPRCLLAVDEHLQVDDRGEATVPAQSVRARRSPTIDRAQRRRGLPGRSPRPPPGRSGGHSAPADRPAPRRSRR